jgi:beta-phosphoglucomutase-like phosphatase (HAD superfamily)
VVEDTAIGVRAGAAAGMTVFGNAELTAPSRLVDAGAALTFREMSMLPEIVRSWPGAVRPNAD